MIYTRDRGSIDSCIAARGALRRVDIGPPGGVAVVRGATAQNFSGFSVALEQYLDWQRCGWTHREMLSAIGSQYLPGTTGDDVFVEIVNAWNSLDRGE